MEKQDVTKPMATLDPAFTVHRSLIPLGLILVSVGLAAWILTFGMQLFSSIDGGITINAAWQEYHGAVPYRDFFTGVPPLFLLPAGWAIDLWGPTWFSLVKLTCVFSVTTFLWSFAIIWDSTKSAIQALIYAIILQAIIVLPGSWWWYNEISWMACVLFFASTLSLLCNSKNIVFAFASFFLSGAAVALSKVNMGAILILSVALLLVFHKRLRGLVLISAIGIFFLDSVFLVLNQISPLQVLENYLDLSARLNLTMFDHLLTVPYEFDGRWQLCSFPILAVTIVICIYKSQWRDLELKWSFLAMFVIALILGCASAGMNYQRKALCCSCLVVILPFLHVQTQSSPSCPKLAKRLSLIIVLALSVMGIYVGSSRTQFEYFGQLSYAPPKERVLFHTPPLLAGMQLSRGFAGVVQDIDRALTDFDVLRSGKSIFFGPNVDFSYAAFDLPSPKYLPLWWEKVPSTHRGDAYPFDEHLPLFCNFRHAGFLVVNPLILGRNAFSTTNLITASS
jgi:hypothetical protein